MAGLFFVSHGQTMGRPITQLVLFDIDGTLLITRGMTSRCIEQSGKKFFGNSFVLGAVTPGHLDHQLFLRVAASNGFVLDPDVFEKWKNLYFHILAGELASRPEDIFVLPGVRELWRRVHELPGLAVGLLTGNFRKASYLKLDAAEIDRTHLDVQVHAEDGESRVALVAAAKRILKNRNVCIASDRITIVGDTPRDIQCAQAAGCRCLAVATGRYSRGQLSNHVPDVLVDDLTDTAAIEAVLGLDR